MSPRIFTIVAGIVLLLLGAGLPAVAQEAAGGDPENRASDMPAPGEDPLLNWFVGTWEGPFQWAGTDTEVMVRAETRWGLGKHFIVARNTADVPGEGEFTQHEYWSPTGEDTYGLWFFDSLGHAGYCDVKHEGDVWIVSGPDCRKEPVGLFRNVSERTGPDSLVYRIEKPVPGEEGEWEVVARGVYRRLSEEE